MALIFGLQTEFWADRFAKCLKMFHLTYFLYYKVLALSSAVFIEKNAERVPMLVIIIIIIAERAVFNVAGYLMEERRRGPVITASRQGQHSK